MSFKIGVLKSFAIFTGKYQCCSLFIIKLQVCKPATLLKRDFNTGVFLWILRNVKNSFFYWTITVAAFLSDVWNLSELHEEHKRLLLSCSGFYIDNLDHAHNWLGCFYWWQWLSKSSWERLYECETSVTSVRMYCNNVTINKKHKVCYISNWIRGYVFIYNKCNFNVYLH